MSWIILAFELLIIEDQNARKISLTVFLIEKMEYDESKSFLKGYWLDIKCDFEDIALITKIFVAHQQC